MSLHERTYEAAREVERALVAFDEARKAERQELIVAAQRQLRDAVHERPLDQAQSMRFGVIIAAHDANNAFAAQIKRYLGLIDLARAAEQ